VSGAPPPGGSLLCTSALCLECDDIYKDEIMIVADECITPVSSSRHKVVCLVLSRDARTYTCRRLHLITVV